MHSWFRFPMNQKQIDEINPVKDFFFDGSYFALQLLGPYANVRPAEGRERIVDQTARIERLVRDGRNCGSTGKADGGL